MLRCIHAVAALIIFVVGCRKDPEPAPVAETPPAAAVAAPDPIAESPEAKKWTWRATSPTGRAMIAQSYLGPGKCRVESTGGSEGWSVDACLSDSARDHYASDDGLSLIVIDPFPSAKPDWRYAPIVWLYTRGELKTHATAGSLFTTSDKLRFFGASFSWLAGRGGLKGVPPRKVSDGVEGTASDGRPLKFGFDGSGLPAPLIAPQRSDVAAADSAPTGDILTWTDASGEVHFTDDPQSIPLKYRKKAKAAQGEDISVVRGGTSPLSGRSPVVIDESTGRPAARGEEAPAGGGGWVYCKYYYLTQANRAPKGMTVVGAPVRMENSYCTREPLAEAQRRCDRTASEKHKAPLSCSCTNDKTYIGSRCD